MFSGFLSAVRIRMGLQPSKNSECSEEEVEVIKIPKIFLEREEIRGGTAKNLHIKDNSNEAIEKYNGVGTITVLNCSMGVAVIDRKYQIDMEKFPNSSTYLKKGSRVKFRAESSRACPQWTVKDLTLLKEEESVAEVVNENFTLKGAIIKSIQGDHLLVKDTMDHPFQIPKSSANVGFEWMPGDWLQLKLEQDCTASTDSTPRVLEVAPLQRKTVIGKITSRSSIYLINDSIYFTTKLCNFDIREGVSVKCTAIKSMRCLREAKDRILSWRAISVEKSRCLAYNWSGDAEAPDKPISKDMEEPQLRRIDDIGKLAIENRELLLTDKFGIKVTPKHLHFPAQQVNTTAIKQLIVRNDSQMTFEIKHIIWKHDPSFCDLQLKLKGTTGDTSWVLFAGDELTFDVLCRPKMVGRTLEMCIFDFGEFTIAWTVSAFGQIEDTLFTEIVEQPKFKKQLGSADVELMTEDLDRRKVKGRPLVRASFFNAYRIPSSPVPKKLYKILLEKNEEELLRAYPKSLAVLSYENYKQKLKVSLWFEEIENHLRRRQYDMLDVRLVKSRDEPLILYTFAAPGIQDLHPPVNIQDALLVFDDDNTKNVKYQGTIAAITDNEVTCFFGNEFNDLYTGFPVTVQFHLGRNNYRRCHYAVQTAVDFLGEDFLFPGDEPSVKPARILLHENEGETVNEELEAVEYNPEELLQSIFRRTRAPTKYIESKPAEKSHLGILGKRAQSSRSRFESDTADTPSRSSAKLVWFNKSLNNEQKNAVRRILEGQARPLPYIIYGPPGTGKTVTMVEAVMQVNKLDTNSRVLVCAPSNSAADVIAKHLVNSGEYRPGEFYRLNGFLRVGQSMKRTIAPYCVTGEDMPSLARHRLIVTTCVTAGQFFELNLSAGHFTHVFVDEAGYCTEPETMVPSILLAKAKGGQLILAGDPNQLGPVLLSDVALNIGLGKSFLERLMARQLYQRDVERFPDEKYNPLMVTRLVNNYRAHQALLKLPSQLFYHDDLLPQASFEEAYALSQHPDMQDIVKVEGVPLIFHGVQGRCAKEAGSSSCFNKAEVLLVVEYVSRLIGKSGLKARDIGIITPYRKQVEKIRGALEKTMDTIPKVASVEEFQGDERKVMIISTVRSVTDNRIKITGEFCEKYSFLYQPKRFNVAITRAKALMIVIGNPHLLDVNTHWSKLLQYALSLNAYRGCNLPVHLDGFLRSNVMDKDKFPELRQEESSSCSSSSEDDD